MILITLISIRFVLTLGHKDILLCPQSRPGLEQKPVNAAHKVTQLGMFPA